jgi:hypothetical protein
MLRGWRGGSVASVILFMSYRLLRPVGPGWPAALRLLVLLVPLALAVPAAAEECLEDTAALRRVLALPAAEKSGRSFCLAPGRYTLEQADFAGAFSGLDPARPVSFTAGRPDDPPVLNMWAFVSRAGEETGNATLRGLAFDLSDMEEVGPGEIGFRGHRVAVQMGVGGPTANVVLDGIRVTGPLREAGAGGRETVHIPVGVHGTRSRNVSVIDSRFERILNGIVLGGEGLLIEGNRMRHSWGDMVRIVPQVLPDGACAPTRGAIVRGNLFYDLWSNFRMHPDFIHMFAASKRPCDISEVLIERNIAFPGLSGLAAPAYPTGLRPAAAAVAPPAVLPARQGLLHLLRGPGQSRLPAADCTDPKRAGLGVQLDPDSAGPVILTPAPGDRLMLAGKAVPEIRLARPWETWQITCRRDRPGEWQVRRSLPAIQGVFASPLPGDAGFHDITVRHNILWASAPKAVGFKDGDSQGISVLHNTFLMPWPGDADGDGRANTYDDGFNEAFAGGRIIVQKGRGHRVDGNVATGPLQGDWPGSNDAEIRHGDGGAALLARFAAAPGPQLLPRTPAEAVALARPRAGGALDGRGFGAVGVRPEDDPVDWGWAAAPW